MTTFESFSSFQGYFGRLLAPGRLSRPNFFCGGTVDSFSEEEWSFFNSGAVSKNVHRGFYVFFDIIIGFIVCGSKSLAVLLPKFGIIMPKKGTSEVAVAHSVSRL